MKAANWTTVFSSWRLRMFQMRRLNLGLRVKVGYPSFILNNNTIKEILWIFVKEVQDFVWCLLANILLFLSQHSGTHLAKTLLVLRWSCKIDSIGPRTIELTDSLTSAAMCLTDTRLSSITKFPHYSHICLCSWWSTTPLVIFDAFSASLKVSSPLLY